MINSELREITDTIAAICSEYPEIMAAYIFGSAVNPSKRPNDIDVAVLLENTASESFSILSFITQLEQILKYPADVVILNRAGELLKYQVRRNGILVFERSPLFRKAFEIRSRKAYEDFLYLHHRYVKSVLYGEKDG